jgi:hypothetical protein
MPLLRNRRLIIVAVIALVIPGAWLVARDTATDDPSIVARVQRGEFTVTVVISGELSARESVKITAPSNSRQANLYQMKIASIIPEGTVVKEGDVVAELDRAELASKMSDVTLALQKAEAVYEQAMLDSTLNLSQAREDIRGLELALEEAELEKEQSVYEPPTIQRQAEINLEKADRALKQARLNYKTKTEQAEAKMREVGADVDRERNKLAIVQDVMVGFTVKAPAPGMVIYEKEWNGQKRKTGSQLSSWDPTVATLPDLTKMESITYVNEIDIRKVAVDQPVRMTLDSDPTKVLTGKVTSVANVGEQRPNTDAKVFEVKIEVAGADTTLRPGMTTGNTIETLREEDVLFVPIETLNSEDGIPFVYLQSGGGSTKQEVVTGAMNDNEVIILDGLAEGDRVLLTHPENRDDMAIRRLPNSPVGAPDVGGDSLPVAGGDTAVGVGKLELDSIPTEER